MSVNAPESEIEGGPGRISNIGKPHRPRTALEPGEIYMILSKVNGKKYIGQVLSLSRTGKPYGTHARWIGLGPLRTVP